VVIVTGIVIYRRLGGPKKADIDDVWSKDVPRRQWNDFLGWDCVILSLKWPPIQIISNQYLLLYMFNIGPMCFQKVHKTCVN